jgi:DNA polymerase
MARRLFIDIETQSELDARKVGPCVYARHPSTKILCLAWASPAGPVHIEKGSPRPLGQLFDFEVLVAHNKDFEREVLLAAGLIYGDEPWEDTAAMAAAMSLPRSLEDLGEFFGFPKDMEGNRVMMQLCRPRRPSADNPDRFWTPETKPEAFERLYQYCGSDVRVMRELHKRMLPMSAGEQAIEELTSKMNQRGVTIDLAAIPHAQRCLAQATGHLEQEFKGITGRPVKSYAKVAQVLGMPDVRKPTVRKKLRDPACPPATRRALEIFTQLARSSTAKLDAMLARAPDGVLRGALVYAGAERTGRWSSMGVQLQNIPRGLDLAAQTDAFEAIYSDTLDLAFEDPVATVADMLRGFLVGPFVIGDFAQIEARTLAWLAGQDDLVQMFRDRGDPYCAMASRIYGRTVTKKDKDERFMGKQVVLGAGYGLGAKNFRRILDETYDVVIDEPFAERVIKTYRKANPKIVKLWDRLEVAFRYVVKNRPGRIRVHADIPIHMGFLSHAEENYAWIELPSGRKMYYARPQFDADDKVRYFGRNIYNAGKWELVTTYGGKLAENVTQATSRDLMAAAMLELYRAGFDLRLTVHDEVVARGKGRAEEFKAIMERVPRWAQGLPIEAEVFESHRYRK